MPRVVEGGGRGKSFVERKTKSLSHDSSASVHSTAQCQGVFTENRCIVPAFQHRVVSAVAFGKSIVPNISSDSEVVFRRQSASPILLMAIKTRAYRYDVIFIGTQGQFYILQEALASVVLNISDHHTFSTGKEPVGPVPEMKIYV